MCKYFLVVDSPNTQNNASTAKIVDEIEERKKSWKAIFEMTLEEKTEKKEEMKKKLIVGDFYARRPPARNTSKAWENIQKIYETGSGIEIYCAHLCKICLDIILADISNGTQALNVHHKGHLRKKEEKKVKAEAVDKTQKLLGIEPAANVTPMFKYEVPQKDLARLCVLFTRIGKEYGVIDMDTMVQLLPKLDVPW